MKAMKFIMPALLPVVLAIACNSTSTEAKEKLADRSVSMDSTAIGVGNTNEQADPKKDGAAQKQVATDHAQPPNDNPDWDKKIVKTAELHVEVKNFRSYTESLHQKVRAAGGYISQEEQNQSPYKIENTVTIKVPVERFDETVLQLASDSDKLEGKKISTEDVTMQVIDTKSRLETRKQVRERYMEMLKQTHSREDILQIQREIDNITAEIEGASGRIAYLGHAAAYSTINLSFFQVLDATVKNDAEPGFLHKLSGAFADGMSWVSSLVIGLTGLWPLLLVGVLGLMWWRRKAAGRRETSAATVK